MLKFINETYLHVLDFYSAEEEMFNEVEKRRQTKVSRYF